MHQCTWNLLASVLLVAGIAAQPSPGQLIGFTAQSASSGITRQTICQPPTNVCPNALPEPTQAYAGGAAYNPADHSVWHTQGTRLVQNYIDTCKQPCLTAAFLSLGPNSQASGLTINPARNEMYQVESLPGTAAVVTYSLKNPAGPCPVMMTACKVALPSAVHLAGAIAYDQKRDLIYVAASVFGAAAPQNTLYIYRRADPSCQPFCKVQVDQCSTGILQAIRGMAYDECQDVMYLTDGRQTSTQVVIWAANCPTFRPLNCCVLNHPAGELWYGFDIESEHARLAGKSCTQPSCAACPNLSLNAVGDPAIGNFQFGAQFANGPTGGVGLVFMGPGPCQVPGLPILCGELYTPLPLFLLGATGLAGAGICDGQGVVSAAIPNDHTLCGGIVCLQGVVICFGAPIGIGLTNGVQIRFGP